MAEQSTKSPDPQKPAKTYGKLTTWQWVIIYVILAVIVYGLIYVLFIRDNSSSSGGSIY